MPKIPIVPILLPYWYTNVPAFQLSDIEMRVVSGGVHTTGRLRKRDFNPSGPVSGGGLVGRNGAGKSPCIVGVQLGGSGPSGHLCNTALPLVCEALDRV